MIIAIVDLETTGLDTLNDRILEVACILFDTEAHRIVEQYSQLVYWPKLSIPPAVTKIHGITEELCEAYGVEIDIALGYFTATVDKSDFIIAHNGNGFDKPIMWNHYRKSNITPPNIPWADSRTDIPYPQHISTRKLLHLAAEHGLQILPGHEAYNDCRMLLDLLKNYDMEDLLKLVNYRKTGRLSLCQQKQN